MIILRQKEYARKDYLGLSVRQADILKNKRSQIAKNLMTSRKNINTRYNEAVDNAKSVGNVMSTHGGYDKGTINKVVGSKLSQARGERDFMIGSDLRASSIQSSKAHQEAWKNSVKDRAKNIKYIRKRDITKDYMPNYEELDKINNLSVGY